MAIITLNNLGQSYGDFDVFLGVTASIENDGKVGLVGPNGIGKTTLLRILSGGDTASSGSVSIAGENRPQHQRQPSPERDAKLQQMAKKMGLTVDELRAKRKADRAGSTAANVENNE